MGNLSVGALVPSVIKAWLDEASITRCQMNVQFAAAMAKASTSTSRVFVDQLDPLLSLTKSATLISPPLLTLGATQNPMNQHVAMACTSQRCLLAPPVHDDHLWARLDSIG
jgi:hypothetical protein